MNTYSLNIKERQPNHPIGMLNMYILVIIYYFCMAQFIDEISKDEDPLMITFTLFFIVADSIMILVSFFSIKKVKQRAFELIENERFKDYRQEAEV